MPRSRSSALSRSNIRLNASSAARDAVGCLVAGHGVADPLGGEELAGREQADDEIHQSFCPPGRHVLKANAGGCAGAALRGARRSCRVTLRFTTSSHRGDELLDPLVDAAVRVLAQHGALRLVVQLEVHPVDGEVAPALLRALDEVAAQLGPGGLRRARSCASKIDEVGDDPLDAPLRWSR